MEVPTFTLLWTNEDTNKDKTMQEHLFQLRDVLPISETSWDLYLDQLIVTYYNNTVYRTEECLVGFSPGGAHHVLYVEDVASVTIPYSMYTPLKYSMGLCVVPGLSSSECQVFRPIRDAAIAHGLDHAMEPIVIELMWPLLGTTNFKLPNSHIKQVLCNFSCRRRH